MAGTQARQDKTSAESHFGQSAVGADESAGLVGWIAAQILPGPIGHRCATQVLVGIQRGRPRGADLEAD